MTNNGDVVEINIEAMLKKAEAPVATECCIYKVPFDIRRHNEEAYTPKVVSIGPFHKGHPRLQDMERHKLSYCKAFVRRTKTSFESLFHEIEKMEPEFRRCYSDSLEKFSKEQLVEIILVDCAFILELFCRSSNKNEKKKDPCLSKPWLRKSIRYDLLLLENQVPFSVLERLFNLSFPSRGDGFLFRNRTFNFFEKFNRSKLNFKNINRIRHFTDMIRTFHLPDPLQARTVGDIMEHLPSATELSEAGLRFKVPEKESCLLKIKFSGGVLEIPQLELADGTETLFRNMVALEQCLYHSKAYITDYVLFLDFLINTNRDVDILVRKRVFVNLLGDTDSVATMFNGLLKNITLSDTCSHHFRVHKELNAFHENRWRKLKSTLRREYCRGPWQTAASIAAISLVILSIVQTVCSILQVIHP